jgi:hypothetical protein
MNLVLDHNLALKQPVVRRWKEGDISPLTAIRANRLPPEYEHRASVRDGTFFWEVKLSPDPVREALAGPDLPVALFPADDRNILVECGSAAGRLERRIGDLPPTEFAVPGYWKASQSLALLLMHYQAALAEFSDADVVALGLAEDL